jgi:7-keto-8-aminopelargonate synthetase-like enzyme
MQDLFAEQLKALRAASLDRHLREISSSQGPEIEIDGRRLVNFSSNAARLRITVTALHQEDQIHSLCEAVKRNSAAA